MHVRLEHLKRFDAAVLAEELWRVEPVRDNLVRVNSCAAWIDYCDGVVVEEHAGWVEDSVGDVFLL